MNVVLLWVAFGVMYVVLIQYECHKKQQRKPRCRDCARREKKDAKK